MTHSATPHAPPAALKMRADHHTDRNADGNLCSLESKIGVLPFTEVAMMTVDLEGHMYKLLGFGHPLGEDLD